VNLHKKFARGDPRRDLFANTFEAYQQTAIAIVAKERRRAGHLDESIQAAGVRKKMLTDLLQGNMTPAEKGHVLHVAQANWSVTKKVRSECNQCGHSQRSDDLIAICKRDRMPGQGETVLGNSR
jgi:hypothetical protein